ncbi:hypothetical protein Hanom_Chr03g00227991 [Helianthus anomalus]
MGAAAEEGSDKRVKNEEYTNPFDDPVQNDSTDSLESSWLLVLFCVINLVTYLDRGVIASTGVNGVPETCNANGECTHGTGIQ